MKRQPVIFIGHGNPMYAIEDNAFTRSLSELGAAVGKPRAVLCVSAHWMTEGSWLTHMKSPKTIHDFYGFPKELFDVRYPAPGSPETAELARASVPNPALQLDDELWGLDHGTWAVLRHMYPEADVPVVQLSIYLAQPAEYHLELGRKLRALRDQGVLIVGSGNIVHNLRTMRWEEGAKPYDWAVEFDAWVKDKLVRRDYEALAREAMASEAGKLSIPTPDHWYPLFYALGASDERDELRFTHESIDNGSISMRCLTLGEK
ncbi:MAG: 4,5-DOPA dioxygenase extradiol [Deltaproteobacteria bacterium]|nr:4,5-DOPA dioxygenase extradiol [Deltaproteobacteria bacterium]